MFIFAGAFRALGSTVETISLEAWNDPQRRFETAWRAKSFAPDVVFSIPNAGYGLHFSDAPDDEERQNLFTDILSIPLILPWDHLLTQAPAYFIRDCLAATPARKGALDRIRLNLENPLNYHQFFDNGHVQAYQALGLLRHTKYNVSLEPAHEHFITRGQMGEPSLITDRVGFSGNIYARRSLGSELKISELKRRVIEAKRVEWTTPGWTLYHRELDRLTDNQREQLGLTPDHPFFWRTAYELLSSDLLTDFRLTVLCAIRHPIDYFGNFVEPNSSSALTSAPHVRYRGSVDYITELPEVYNRYALWVDMTNTPYVRSCGSKALNCFAAGSMMLIDYNPDYHDQLGDLGTSFMYRTADELNDKIAFYLAHPKERAEIVSAMQSFIRNGPRMSRFIEQACSEVG